jgi:hypothetical protein
VYTSNGVLLVSNAYVSACDGSKSSQGLLYTWSVLKNGLNDATVVSSSRNPSQFLVSAYTLSVGVTYTMTVTVYDVRSQRASTSNVNVYVAASTLVAAVSGGLSKSVRQLTSFSVDGSISYDNDQKNQGNSGLLFSWTCVQTAPSFSSSCGVGIDASSASSMVLTGTSTALSTTSSITLVVSDGAGRSATLAVSLGVLSASAPIVTMLTAAPPKINVNTVLYLSASTQLIGSGQLTWTVSDSSLDLSSLSPVSPVSQYTPSVATSAGSTAYSNLILPANTLPPNSVLTFTLTCVSPSSTVAGTSSIVIVTNGPPVPGVFAVSPTSGEELKSTFRFLATTWTDPDTPLTYSFGFQVSSSSPYLEVQSKSQQTYGRSLLPAGLSSNNQLVTCIANIFDSYSANTSAYFSVAVDKMTVNASALSSLVANQLSSSSGDADGTKQAISTLSSVLNSVNCSGAPHCASLNREGCSSVANTCGPCLSGGLYVGASGNSNRPCVSLASIVSSSSSNSRSNATSGSTVSVGASAGSACKSDGTCNGWLSCNAATKLCYMPSKSCSVSDCNGQGSCGFIAVSTGFAVSSCTADDVTCEATCTCASGFSGDSCEYSAEELLSKQAIRMQLSESLVSLMSLENPDNEVIIGWANSASAITQNAYEISNAAGALTLNASAQIISSASGNGVNYAAISQVLGSVDNVVTAMTSYSSRRRLALASVSASASASSSVISGSCPKDMLMSFASLASASMVAGQAPTQSVSTNFRLAASVFDMSTSSTAQLGIPVSSLEAAYNQQQSAVSFTGAASTSFAMSAVSLRASAFSHTNFECPQIVELEPCALHANPVRVSLATSALTCDATNPKRQIQFSLHNNEVQYYGNVTGRNSSSANTTVFTTTCTSGLVANFTYPCSNGLNVTVRCDGKAGVWKSRCPLLESRPKCVLLSSSSGLADISCHVVNYTSTETTCSCTLCDLSTDGDVRRRLDVISGRGVMELSTIASFAGKDFASTMASASSFTSLAAIKSSILVIATFGGLWIGMFVLLWSISNSHIISNVSKFLEKDGKIEATPADASQALHKNITDYVAMLLPNVFSEKSRSVRLYTQIMHHHQYLSLLSMESGYRRWVKLLELLTNLTANMFLLAVFYDIQWPSDDGACELMQTQVGCEALKSYFDADQNRCTWKPSDSSPSGGSCVWLHPTYNSQVMVMISVLVVAISAPLNFMLGYLFHKILMSPTLEDLNQRANENRRRRQSAVNVLNTSSVVTLTKDAERKRIRKINSNEEVTNDGTSLRLFKSTACVPDRITRGRLAAQRHTQHFGEIMKEHQAAAKFDIDQLVPAVNNYVSHLNTRERSIMQKSWPTSMFSTKDDEESSELEYLKQDIKSANDEANEWIGKLEVMKAAHVGVHIMNLFMRDMIGRDTQKCKIFMNQLNTISQERVMTWGLKCVGFTIALLLNLYLIYACTLYGHAKGMDWQQGWLIASAVNLVLDIFIKQANIAAVIYYLIPDLIVDTGRTLRTNLEKSIELMCASASQGKLNRLTNSRTAPFSASDYFFVSTRVARAFPGLLESAIVLSYRNPAMPVDIREKWGIHSKVGVRAQVWAHLQRWDMSSTVSLLLTTLLMSLGTQAVIVQKIVVTSLNPALIAVIALIGSFILRRPLMGTLIVVGCLLFIGSFATAWTRKDAERKIAIRQAEKLGALSDDHAVGAGDTPIFNTSVVDSMPVLRSVPLTEHAKNGLDDSVDFSSDSSEEDEFSACMDDVVDYVDQFDVDTGSHLRAGSFDRASSIADWAPVMPEECVSLPQQRFDDVATSVDKSMCDSLEDNTSEILVRTRSILSQLTRQRSSTYTLDPDAEVDVFSSDSSEGPDEVDSRQSIDKVSVQEVEVKDLPDHSGTSVVDGGLNRPRSLAKHASVTSLLSSDGSQAGNAPQGNVSGGQNTVDSRSNARTSVAWNEALRQPTPSRASNLVPLALSVSSGDDDVQKIDSIREVDACGIQHGAVTEAVGSCVAPATDSTSDAVVAVMNYPSRDEISTGSAGNLRPVSSRKGVAFADDQILYGDMRGTDTNGCDGVAASAISESHVDILDTLSDDDAAGSDDHHDHKETEVDSYDRLYRRTTFMKSSGHVATSIVSRIVRVDSDEDFSSDDSSKESTIDNDESDA